MSKKLMAGSKIKGGGFWLYGVHPVQTALINPCRQKLKLIATHDAYESLSSRLGQPVRVQHEIVDRIMLDKICGRDAVHQGVALQVMPLPNPDVRDILKREGPVLILDQVTDPRNIGAILRSAVAFGAAGVIIQDRHSPEETGVLAKSASGALDCIPIMRAVNLSRVMNQLKEEGLWIVGLDAGGAVLKGQDFAKRRVVLVLGAEGTGMRQLTRQNCDEIASLHMAGDIDSLNVSVAGAIALYEITRAL